MQESAVYGNSRGFFESQAIANWNDVLMATMGSSWRDWCSLDRDVLSSLPREIVARAIRLLAEEFGGDAPLFVLKDPRICRFVPLWLSALREAGVTPCVVIPFRAPLEVAHSLRERDGFAIETGLLLWLRHVFDAEWETRGLRRAFVSMEEFLDDWRESVRWIARDTGAVLPLVAESSAKEIDRFLSRDLKHHNLSDSTLATAHVWASRAYDALLILARHPFGRRGTPRSMRLHSRSTPPAVCLRRFSHLRKARFNSWALT
ncbi:MAG: hypothetical protein FJX45_19050 [Alphaproteobacteria bacterium]|nr:hypothetical protein [Alphaproteobacteria bacterium]